MLVVCVSVVPCMVLGQQSPAPAGDPVLQGLSASEFAALRPFAERGAGVLVRDADSGPRARITVLVRARAPIDTVRGAIMAPESYATFMPTIAETSVVSRHGDHVAFRFRVSAVIFDVDSLSALHRINDHRVDAVIVRSDIGPGASRWDLLEDGDGTLVALSTWGDPSRGNWLLRQVAARSPNAIAGMNISTDILLTMGLARRAEIVAGRALPVRPSQREAPTGVLAPPAAGAWRALTHGVVVAAIGFDDDRVLTQSSVALHSDESPEAICRRLENVSAYGSVWHGMRDVRVVQNAQGVVRFSSVVRGPMSEARGEQEVSVSPGAEGPVVHWRGVAGDFAGHDHRWDLVRDGSGTIVVLTGGSEFERAGAITRAMIARDVWLLAGFSASWKLVWMRPLVQVSP